MGVLGVCIPVERDGCREPRYTIEDNIILLSEYHPYVLFKHDNSTRILCEGSSMQLFQWGSERYTLWMILPPGKCVVVEAGIMSDHRVFYTYSRKNKLLDNVSLGVYGRLLKIVLRSMGYMPIITDDDSAMKLVNTVHVSNEDANKLKLDKLIGWENSSILVNYVDIVDAEEGAEYLDY